jgi:6-phosphogluconolactonase/glucosamine-6-phosphate isomerase/deaminase
MYTGFLKFKNPMSDVETPHDGSGPGVAWAKRDELGETSARLVKSYLDASNRFKHRNRIVLLSGPKPSSIAETLETLAKIAGTEVKITQVRVDEYVNDSQNQEVIRSHRPDNLAKD